MPARRRAPSSARAPRLRRSVESGPWPWRPLPASRPAGVRRLILPLETGTGSTRLMARDPLAPVAALIGQAIRTRPPKSPLAAASTRECRVSTFHRGYKAVHRADRIGFVPVLPTPAMQDPRHDRGLGREPDRSPIGRGRHRVRAGIGAGGLRSRGNRCRSDGFQTRHGRCSDHRQRTSEIRPERCTRRCRQGAPSRTQFVTCNSSTTGATGQPKHRTGGCLRSPERDLHGGIHLPGKALGQRVGERLFHAHQQV